MNNQYEYFEKPLTPGRAEKLITELFAGQTVQRQEIMRIVDETHRERGGRPSRARFHHPVTLALPKMKRRGHAENPRQGVWFIPSSSQEDESVDDESLNSEEVNLDSERTVGSGENSVYLYYFPAYKRLAELQGEQVWPCKIGKTRYDAISRISSQTRTALPEYPKIGLIIKTDKVRLMETTIQNIMKLQGKQKSDAPGTEWFITSPSEVEQVYESNFGGLQ